MLFLKRRPYRSLVEGSNSFYQDREIKKLMILDRNSNFDNINN